MSIANVTPTSTPYESGRRGMVVGLIVLGSAIALVTLITISVLGIMLATGTLRHTSQGWSFQAVAGSAVANEIRNDKLDPKVDSLFIADGSGAGRTAQFTASGEWRADWAYSCPSNAAFQVVALGTHQSYPAGDASQAGSGAGNSNQLPAGTYSFNVATDPGCSWSVGARPNH